MAQPMKHGPPSTPVLQITKSQTVSNRSHLTGHTAPFTKSLATSKRMCALHPKSLAKSHIHEPHLWVDYAGDELLVEPALESGRDAKRRHEAAVRDKILRWA